MFNPEGLSQNAEPAKDVATLLQGSKDVTMEKKLDGFRLLAHIEADAGGKKIVTCYTRTGKSQRGKIPHIEAELAKLPANTWLDGEIVAFDDKGLPEWGKVQTVMGANTDKAAERSACLTYVVFDLLALDGNDIRALPLRTRREALNTIFAHIPMVSARVTLIDQYEATDETHEMFVAEGWEGSIVKRLDAPYASGKRGKGWYKLKANDEMDVVIMGFKPGENSFTGLVGALDFGQYKDGQLVYRGRCSGMDMKTRVWMTEHIVSLIAEEQVISLAYMGIMPSGSPRHPQYKRLRDDKPAEECTWSI